MQPAKTRDHRSQEQGWLASMDDPRFAALVARLPAWVPGLVLAALLIVLAATSARSFLRGHEGDFIFFWSAASAGSSGGDIYADAHKQGYGYLPMLAILMRPLVALPLATAGAIWCFVNAGLIFATLWVGAHAILRSLGVPATPKFVGLVAMSGGLVMIDNLRDVLRLGQSDPIVMLACATAFALIAGQAVATPLRAGRVRALVHGFALGVASNIKFQGFAFLPWLAIRRRWGELAWSLAGTVAIALAGAIVFGWERNLDYLRRAAGGLGGVLGASRDANVAILYPLTWDRSVSIPSTFARLAERLGAGSWAIVVGVGACALSCFAIAWVLYARGGAPMFAGRGGDNDRVRHGPLVAIEWAGLITAMLVFAPQTTNRHMIALVFVAMLALATILLRPRGVKPWIAIAGLVLGVASLVLPPGGRQFREALTTWRAIGGPSWCVLVMFFCTAWSVLRWRRCTARA